jgi:hypothetical protein
VAEKELSQMDKCCGLCLCPCSRKYNFEGSSSYAKKDFKTKDPNKKGGDSDSEDENVSAP